MPEHALLELIRRINYFQALPKHPVATFLYQSRLMPPSPYYNVVLNLKKMFLFEKKCSPTFYLKKSSPLFYLKKVFAPFFIWKKVFAPFLFEKSLRPLYHFPTKTALQTVFIFWKPLWNYSPRELNTKKFLGRVSKFTGYIGRDLGKKSSRPPF